MTSETHDHSVDEDMVIANNNAFIMAMGDGSRIEIHAADRDKDGWTQLEETAEVGSNQLVLQTAPGWEPGDKIAIASTSADLNEAEEFTVVSVSEDGKTITLDGIIENEHRGETVSYNNGQTGDDYREWDVEIRAEVALLSRNVRIEGDADSVDDGYGGHVMAMDGAEMHIEGAEFYHMGQEDLLGKYPIHWHMLGDASGQYAINNSIHESFQKGSTIHGSSNLVYEGNVIYEHVGHGVFLEDGSENTNYIMGNLVFGTRESLTGEPIPTDAEHASSYWIENANNYFIGNHAAGSESNGFWIIPTSDPHGLSASTYVGDGSTLADLVFISNTGHTNSGNNGAGGEDKTLGVDGRLTDDLDFRQFTLDGGFGVLQDFTAYEGNVWLLTDELVVSDSSLVDTRLFIRHENFVEDTLLAKEDKGGVGVAIYRDGGQQLSNVHLADGFRLILLNTDHQNSQDAFNNVTVEGATYQQVMTWLSSSAVYQKTVIDIDGSFTGTPGTFLVPDTEIGAFKAPPGAVYSDDYESWLSTYTVGATEVTLLDGDGDTIDLSGSFRILRSDGESSDDHPTSTDKRNQGDFNNDENDRSDATYEFNTATSLPQDVAYLLDVDFPASVTDPVDITLNLAHVREGDSVVYEVPGVAGQAFVTDGSLEVFSYDDLLEANETAYFSDATSGSLFVRLVATDVEVYEDRPVDDLLADFRASDSIEISITGQDDLDFGSLTLTDDLITAIADQPLRDDLNAPEIADATVDVNESYIGYDLKMSEAASLHDVTDTLAEAAFEICYDVESRTVKISGEFSDLSSDATMAHLHQGAEDETGGVIEALTISTDDGRNGTFEATFTISAAEADLLLSGDTYVNLHTVDNAAGELRGQVELQAAGDFTFDRPESTSDTTVVTDGMARWSDESTWGGAGVPGVDDVVVIGPDQTVVLDDSVLVKGIIVNGGELIVEDDADLDIHLSTDYLLVIEGGLFQAGTEDDPLDTNFVLTLEGDDPDFDLEVGQYVHGHLDNTVFAAAVTGGDDIDQDITDDSDDEMSDDGEPEDYDDLETSDDGEIEDDEPKVTQDAGTFALHVVDVESDEALSEITDGAMLKNGAIGDDTIAINVDPSMQVGSLAIRVGDYVKVMNAEQDESDDVFTFSLPEGAVFEAGETVDIEVAAYAGPDATGDVLGEVGYRVDVPEETEDDDSEDFFLVEIFEAFFDFLFGLFGGGSGGSKAAEPAEFEQSDALLSDLIPTIEFDDNAAFIEEDDLEAAAL